MKELFRLFERKAWILPVLVFLVCGLRYVDLPGLYMDAVNPDYLAAHALHPALNNFRFLLPGNAEYTYLGNYYHGVQNYYEITPILAFFGSSMFAIRFGQLLFGALVVGASTTLLQKLSGSWLLAMVMGLALATDIALIASFRDQNYIVLSGFAWLLLAVNALIPSASDEPCRPHQVLISGGCSGLAVYGYFVHLFFLPAVLVILLVQAQSKFRSLVLWSLGFALGLVLYVIGYVRMYIELGGLQQMAASLGAGVNGLHPLEHQSLMQRIESIFRFIRLAVSGDESDMMILGRPLGSTWGHVKTEVLIVATGVLILLAIIAVIRRRRIGVDLLIGLLPLSFATCGLIFGSRLGAHHFSVMIAFVYITAVALLHRLLDSRNEHAKSYSRGAIAMVAMASLVVIAANFSQQQKFFRALNETGGVGRSSSALTLMAQNAMNDRGLAIYVFPDWGFFTSFALLTENRIPYVVDANEQVLNSAHRQFPTYGQIRLVYWSDQDTPRYTQVLENSGLKNVSRSAFLQRDGKDAFFMLTGFY